LLFADFGLSSALPAQAHAHEMRIVTPRWLLAQENALSRAHRLLREVQMPNAAMELKRIELACPACKRSFTERSVLFAHMDNRHSNAKKYNNEEAIQQAVDRSEAAAQERAQQFLGEIDARGGDDWYRALGKSFHDSERALRTQHEARYSPPQQQVAPSHRSAVGEEARYPAPMGVAGYAAAALVFGGGLYFLVKRYGDKM